MSDYDSVSEAARLVVLKIGSCAYVDELAVATALRAAYDAGSREAEVSRLRSALHACASLTRYQASSPHTVHGVSLRVAEIVAEALGEAGDA